MRRYFWTVLVAISLVCIPLVYAEITAQLGGMDADGDYYWTIDDDGTLIGGTGAEISLGGEEKSSWGDIVSPMTDEGDYVVPTDAGSRLKLWNDGDLTLGGGIATNVVITFDSDSNDYYVGVNDTENELQIGYGSAIGTTEQMSFTSGAKIMLGEDTDVDFGLVFQSGDQDYYIGIDYESGQEDDLLTIGRGNTVGATPELAIGASKVYLNHLDSFGNVDLDIGNSTLDDVTIETDGGIIILDGSITLSGSEKTNNEIISNATDDTIRVASDDSSTVLEIYTPNDSNGDATLKLSADLGNEVKEQWTITSTGSSNDLVIANDYAFSGTPVTKFTLDEEGAVTTTGAVECKITDTSTTTVRTVLVLTHDGGAAATNVGVGMEFKIDDAGGIEKQASIGVTLTDVTDSGEDADIVFSQNIAGSFTEVLRLDADAGIDLPLAGYVITLPYDEGISNATDDMVQIYSNDNDMRLEIYSPKAADGDATLSLQGDAAAIAHSRWDFISDTGADALIIKSDSSTVDVMVTKFTIASADGDITTTGDIEIVDDMDLVFGTNSDWKVQYNESVDDQLIFLTANTQAIATTDPMFVIIAGASATPNQQIFGVGRGTQGSYTALFSVDEDGDVDITGSIVDVLTLSAELLLSNETVTCDSTDPQGVGVADPDVVVTFVVTDDTGASADLVTLADGTTGEIKIIILKTDTETTGLIVRPANLARYTEILFEETGDSCTLIFDGSNWSIIALNGGTES